MSLRGHIRYLARKVDRDLEREPRTKEKQEMPQKVILSVGGDDYEAGTVEEVINLTGPIYHEIDERANIAYGIAKYIASVVESLTLDPDYEADSIRIELQ
jgi:hypothetical protein